MLLLVRAGFAGHILVVLLSWVGKSPGCSVIIVFSVYDDSMIKKNTYHGYVIIGSLPQNSVYCSISSAFVILVSFLSYLDKLRFISTWTWSAIRYIPTFQLYMFCIVVIWNFPCNGIMQFKICRTNIFNKNQMILIHLCFLYLHHRKLGNVSFIYICTFMRTLYAKFLGICDGDCTTIW